MSRAQELDEVLEVFADAGSTINLVVTREVPPGIRRDGSGLTLLTLPIGSPGTFTSPHPPRALPQSWRLMDVG